MNNEKRNFKEEFKDWWSENKDKIKIGAKCLSVGLLVGFVKGVLTEGKVSSRVHSELIKKIPYEPDCDDIAEYIHDNIDEFKPYVVSELEFNK